MSAFAGDTATMTTFAGAMNARAMSSISRTIEGG
jgi:hypothetical protein